MPSSTDPGDYVIVSKYQPWLPPFTPETRARYDAAQKRLKEERVAKEAAYQEEMKSYVPPASLAEAIERLTK